MKCGVCLCVVYELGCLCVVYVVWCFLCVVYEVGCLCVLSLCSEVCVLCVSNGVCVAVYVKCGVYVRVCVVGVCVLCV